MLSPLLGRSPTSPHKRSAPLALRPEAECREVLEADLLASPKVLTLFETRGLVRDCLASWMAAVCPEFETIALTEVDLPDSNAAIAKSAVVILGVMDGTRICASIANRIASVREIREDVAIGAIGPPDMALAMTLFDHPGIQGYIPNTTTSEVAAAALRLMAAGGTYMPYLRGQSPAGVLPLSLELPLITSAAAGSLTLREQAVLRCIQRGLPNKLIAHELGISIGTVKLHVHNVIGKMKVHNRTEVAIAVRRDTFGEGPS